MGFRLPSIIVADVHISSGGTTYFYKFAYKASDLGVAIHVLDLFFVFGTLGTTDISEAMKLGQTEEEEQLSMRMMDAWTSFTRAGNPNHENLPMWRKYDSDTRSNMVPDVESKLVTNQLDNRMEFWKSLNLL